MQELMNKYITAYQHAEGDALAKVKSVLMHHVGGWDWVGSESTVADLLDDTHITANDIVDFLASSYEYEGGNEEFHYAVRALQVSLRKAQLHAMKPQSIDDCFESETNDDTDTETEQYGSVIPGMLSNGDSNYFTA